MIINAAAPPPITITATMIITTAQGNLLSGLLPASTTDNVVAAVLVVEDKVVAAVVDISLEVVLADAPSVVVTEAVLPAFVVAGVFPFVVACSEGFVVGAPTSNLFNTRVPGFLTAIKSCFA